MILGGRAPQLIRRVVRRLPYRGAHEMPTLSPRSLALLLLLSACQSRDVVPWKWGTPHPGAWQPTKTFRGDLFSIQYPATAHAEVLRTPAGPKLVISELPGCRWPCSIVVRTWPDSAGAGLDGLVKSLTTPLAGPDSRIGCAERASVLDTLRLDGCRGARLAMPCCDCVNEAIYSASQGEIVEIAYLIDDREPAKSPYLAKLQMVARSFRWQQL